MTVDEAELHVKWLAQLHDELWVTKCSAGQAWSCEHRRMTDDEWARVQSIITTERLICEPINAQMGFGFGMRLYEHEQYPGTGPTFLLTLTGGHLPEPSDTRFDAGWAAYSPYTHNDDNANALEYAGFEPLRPKGHYAY